MTYATQQDLVDRLGLIELVQLTDRDEDPTGEVDATMVADALVTTDAEINSYLRKQMVTPLDPVPDQVKSLAIDMARYRLYKENPPVYVRTAYTDAVAWLKLAASGSVSLGDADAPTTPANGGVVTVSAPCRTFSREKMKGF